MDLSSIASIVREIQDRKLRKRNSMGIEFENDNGGDVGNDFLSAEEDDSHMLVKKDDVLDSPNEIKEILTIIMEAFLKNKVLKG